MKYLEISGKRFPVAEISVGIFFFFLHTCRHKKSIIQKTFMAASPIALQPVPLHFNSQMAGVKQLSNSHLCMLKTRVDGHVMLTTVDHEYQARKMEVVFDDASYAEHIRALPTPKEAKKAGSMSAWVEWEKAKTPHMTKKALKKEFKEMIRQRWIPVFIKIMRELLMQKFNPNFNKDLWEFLNATGDRPLHEIGRPNFWTKDGKDALGRLLRDVRNEWRIR